MTKDEAFNHIARHWKTLPDESMWEGAVEQITETISGLSDRISDEEMAVLIGIGAIMYRQGFREFQAGIRTAMVLNRAKPSRKGGRPHQGE